MSNHQDDAKTNLPYEEELTTDLDDETTDRPRGVPLHTKIIIGLIFGTIAGLVVNRIFGGNNS